MKQVRSTGTTTTPRTILLALVSVCLATWATTGRADPPIQYQLPDLKALEQAFESLADTVRPGVVAIRAYSAPAPSSGLVKIPLSQGSGFVIDADGYVATNHHVIEGADFVTVVLMSGQEYGAEIRQVDRRSDLAVLKIDAENLQPVHWGDLAEVKIGQWAFACGNPFGFANLDGNTSLTVGVVSALGRQMTHRLEADSQIHYYGNLIETSAPINPGSSGGPLFNIDGQIIGVVVAIETRSGVSEGAGFAIPINDDTWQILDTLMAGEQVRYGFMGVTVEDVPPPESRRVADLTAQRGAKIRGITPTDGPAAQAGLKPGDIVIKVDGEPVENSDHLVRLIQYRRVGANVDVTYLRKQVKRRTAVTLGDREQLLGIAASE
jgi:serine protease Do